MAGKPGVLLSCQCGIPVSGIMSLSEVYWCAAV